MENNSKDQKFDFSEPAENLDSQNLKKKYSAPKIHHIGFVDEVTNLDTGSSDTSPDIDP